MPPADNNVVDGPRTVPLAFLMRMALRIARARWFSFLRRVFRYQNASTSDLVSNPFNSSPWLAAEFVALVAQIIIVSATMAVSGTESPVWPLRIWLGGYNLGNLLSLPLIYWRYRHSALRLDSDDLEQHSRTTATTDDSSSSYLMNKSRTFLELFFAIWFVMGNVWIFDSRRGSFDGAPKLHVLCIAILTWNALLYSFPFLLFVLLCCCVPLISSRLGFNMNLASADRGASEDQLSKLPRRRFKEVVRDLANENQECCICLAQYGEREEVRQLPCRHLFHLDCVDQWLRIMSSCPLCKQDLQK